MKTTTKKNDVWSHDQKYLSGAFFSMAVITISSCFFFGYLNRSLGLDKCRADLDVVNAFWPPNSHIALSLMRASFSETQKCLFLFNQSLYSAFLLFWLFINICAISYSSPLFSARLFFISLCTCIGFFFISYAGFQDKGVYSLNYSQGYTVNLIRALFNVGAFYISAFMTLYSAISYVNKVRR